MSTLGTDLFNSPELESLVASLANHVSEKASNLEPGRQAQKSEAARFEKLLADYASVRGRPLFYEYIGTGLGRGAYVELADGSVKLDLINGIGVHIMGHSHPGVMKEAIKGAAADIIMQGHLEMNSEYLEISQRVLSLAKGSRLKHCWLCPSGSMANENALKMARQKNSPARHVLAMEGAFAGRTTMMAELTDNPAYRAGLPRYNEVLRLPFYDKNDPQSSEKSLAALKEHIAKHPNDISAFCFEPMLGEGGYKVAPLEFFKPLFEECKKNNIAIWADEVQTFLRTGEPFAFQTLGFAEYVDLCTVAKTAQVGMTLYTDEYNPKPGLVAGTFASSTAALRAGIKVLDIMETGNYFGPQGKVNDIHNKFVKALQDLCDGELKGLLHDPEGLGLMVAVTPFDGDKTKILKLLKILFAEGLIAFGCGKEPFRLRFLLPAILEQADIDFAMNILKDCILKFEE